MKKRLVSITLATTMLLSLTACGSGNSGGAAGTALFSTILSVAQAGAGEEGSTTFRHATAVGGSWTFATMIGIVAIAICCLIAAFRIGAKRNSRL